MLFVTQCWYSSLLVSDSQKYWLLACHDLQALFESSSSFWPVTLHTQPAAKEHIAPLDTAVLSCPLFIVQISLFWAQAQARAALRLSDAFHSPCQIWDVTEPRRLLSYLTPTHTKVFYCMSSCASCPITPTSCTGTSCASQQHHSIDAERTSHQSVSKFLHCVIFFLSKMSSPIYFFTLSNPTSLSHHLFRSLKPEAIFF